MLDLNQISHSHDQLEVIYQDQILCVRKTFKGNINRVERGVAKQKNFRPIYFDNARITSVSTLDFKINEFHAELLMPYVDGITGDNFPIFATKQMANSLSDSLSTLIFREINESKEKLILSSVFSEKLQHIERETRDEDLKKLIFRVIEIIKKLPKSLIFPVGECHGDLTLNNLILNPTSGIILIDFLDTYLETPLQDVAKLKQDFDYGWSFRNSETTIIIKAEIFCEKNYPHAIRQIEELYPIQTKALTLLTLARISPYVKDRITKDWLKSSLIKCIGEWE
jgi:hypothetical protein